jgi:hypothetical protein
VREAFINPQGHFDGKDSYRTACSDFGGHLDAGQKV